MYLIKWRVSVDECMSDKSEEVSACSAATATTTVRVAAGRQVCISVDHSVM